MSAVGILFLGIGCDSTGNRSSGHQQLPPTVPEVVLQAEDLDLPGALEILRLQNARDAEGLRRALSDPDPRIRARATLALASVQDTAARGELERLLDDPVPRVRAGAAFALGQLPSRDEGRSLLRAFDSERRRPAASASGAVSAADSAGGTVPGASGVRDGEEVLLRLVEALGKQGGRSALEGLLRAEAAHPEEPSRAGWPNLAAPRQLALGRLLLRGTQPGPQGPGWLAPEATDALTKDALDALMEGLGSPDPEVRAAAAWVFGRLPDPEVWGERVEGLRETLQRLDTSDPAASPLLAALARRRNSEDVPRFSSWLRASSDWRVRTTAARALGASGWVGSDAALEALWEAMEEDPSQHVRFAAAEALAVLLPPVPTPRLLEWLDADGGSPEGWRTRVPFVPGLLLEGHADQVLSWARRTSARQPRSSRSIATAMAAGGEIDPEAMAFFLELAGESDPERRIAGLMALSEALEMATGDQLAAIVGLLEDALVPGSGPGEVEAAVLAARSLAFPVLHGFGASALLERALESLLAPAPPSGGQRGVMGEDRGAEPSAGDGSMQRFPPSGSPSDVTNPAHGRLVAAEAVLVAMGELGDPVALTALEAALSDPRPRIRAAASDALERLTGVPGRGLNLPPTHLDLDEELLRRLGPHPRWILETERGTVVVRLVPAEAPVTVQAVAALTDAGGYDGVPFHRVIGNFVAQGGDVILGNGTGAPGFTLRSEFTRIPFVRGVVGMASAGKDTEGSQFFLVHSDQPHLDGGYTAFGWVEEGADAMDQLLPGDRIIRARMEVTAAN